jgi:hypothetical protein
MGLPAPTGRSLPEPMRDEAFDGHCALETELHDCAMNSPNGE